MQWYSAIYTGDGQCQPSVEYILQAQTRKILSSRRRQSLFKHTTPFSFSPASSLLLVEVSSPAATRDWVRVQLRAAADAGAQGGGRERGGHGSPAHDAASAAGRGGVEAV